MKKLFYVLCMSALIFTGCKKSSSPGNNLGNGDGGGDDDSSSEIFNDFCKANPQTEPCPSLAAKTPLTVQEVKPAMKLRLSSSDSDILYGATNPSKWKEGYSDLGLASDFMINFSVEAGSVLSVGQSFDAWAIFKGKMMSEGSHPVTAVVGGDEGIQIGGSDVTMVQVVIFENLGKFFYLPPLTFRL